MTISRSDAGEDRVVRIVAAVLIDEAGKTLLVRKRGTAAFMQPGGKKDAGETSLGALTREIEEELGIRLDAGLFAPLGTFRAPAANEPGWTVEAEMFSARADVPIAVAAEIEEAVWVDPAACGELVLAPLTRQFAMPAAALMASVGRAG
jgi:8-oxo-dGTP pyrophosphatase MutT (NUDIX family)